MAGDVLGGIGGEVGGVVATGGLGKGFANGAVVAGGFNHGSGILGADAGGSVWGTFWEDCGMKLWGA